jgi:hypothetical protein
MRKEKDILIIQVNTMGQPFEEEKEKNENEA